MDNIRKFFDEKKQFLDGNYSYRRELFNKIIMDKDPGKYDDILRYLEHITLYYLLGMPREGGVNQIVAQGELSTYSSERMIISVEKLCRSSENLEKLTYVLILFTAILFLIEIIKIANGS